MENLFCEEGGKRKKMDILDMLCDFSFRGEKTLDSGVSDLRLKSVIEGGFSSFVHLYNAVKYFFF